MTLTTGNADNTQNTAWINFTIERGPIRGELSNIVGLKFTVIARPEIEAFMKSSANERIVSAEEYSDLWVNLNDSKTSPKVYLLSNTFQSNEYTLNGVGQPPIIYPNPVKRALDDLRIGGTPQANLSFLTLVGISSNNGVSFGIKGAYSFDYVKTLKSTVTTGLTQFLRDYITPISINLHIVSKN